MSASYYQSMRASERAWSLRDRGVVSAWLSGEGGELLVNIEGRPLLCDEGGCQAAGGSQRDHARGETRANHVIAK